jgi:ComF family protein
MPSYRFIQDLISIAFPEICNACGKALYKHEKLICNYCKIKLPYTNFHLETDNPVEKIFWGRVPLDKAGAYLFFHKGSRVQNLMHRFKYKGKKEIGNLVGSLYGSELHECNFLADANLIIPVPLHPDKEKKRGYNQSLHFALGLSQSTGIPCRTDILIRAVASTTQTRKNRFERWQNVESIFKIEQYQHLQNKHIILVDDVITTGATVEACANALMNASPQKISFLAMACAIK